VVRWCDLDFVRSALQLIPISTVYDSRVQYVSPGLFAIVITMSDEEPFDQALLLQLWWSHREVSPR
jgi:hypothetical protein